MTYLLLIKGSFAEWNKFSEQERRDFYALFSQYAEELRRLGYMSDGDGCGERSFRIYSKNFKPDSALVDITTRDMVTGYFKVSVPNESEALRVASLCPAFDCGEYVELVPCSE